MVWLVLYVYFTLLQRSVFFLLREKEAEIVESPRIYSHSLPWGHNLKFVCLWVIDIVLFKKNYLTAADVAIWIHLSGASKSPM